MVNRGPNPTMGKWFALAFGSPLAIVITLMLFGAWRNSGYKIGNKTIEEWRS